MDHYYYLLKFHLENLKQRAISSWFPKEDDYKVQYLPDDILFEILNRLPAEKVLDFRRVCKHWKALTSTPSFITRHERNATPSIIIAFFHRTRHGQEEERVFLFDELGETSTLKNEIRRLGPKKSIYPVPVRNNSDNRVQYNLHGLIVFAPAEPLLTFPHGQNTNLGFSKVLYNPVTRQAMVLNTEEHGFICGYFYHSLADEYRIMWCEGEDKSFPIRYQILDLGSPTWRRLPSIDYLPSVYSHKPFLLNNKFMHWITSEENNTTRQPRCNQAILIFDINKEEFSTMPHPGGKCINAGCRHRLMYLLEVKCEVESFLCFCDCSTRDQIQMWVLEDYDERIWVRRHTVVLNLAMYRREIRCREKLIPFGLLNGKLLINMGKLGVFAYDIKTGTLRRIIDVVNGSIGIQTREYVNIYAGLFYKSLTSFTNFKDLYFNMGPC